MTLTTTTQSPQHHNDDDTTTNNTAAVQARILYTGCSVSINIICRSVFADFCNLFVVVVCRLRLWTLNFELWSVWLSASHPTPPNQSINQSLLTDGHSIFI